MGRFDPINLMLLGRRNVRLVCLVGQVSPQTPAYWGATVLYWICRSLPLAGVMQPLVLKEPRCPALGAARCAANALNCTGVNDPTRELLAQRRLECWIERRAFEMWLGYLTPLKWGVIGGTVILSAIGGAPLLRHWLGETWVAIGGACALIAAILAALHTGLRCEEHQAECRHLIQFYRALERDYQRSGTLPDSLIAAELERLDKRLNEETSGSRAAPPRNLWVRAEQEAKQLQP
jgi:hypothetical protein